MIERQPWSWPGRTTAYRIARESPEGQTGYPGAGTALAALIFFMLWAFWGIGYLALSLAYH